MPTASPSHGGGGQPRRDDESDPVLPPPPSLIAEVREYHMQRQRIIRACTSLTLQIKAVDRRLNKGQIPVEYGTNVAGVFYTLPFAEARSVLEQEKKRVSKILVSLAPRLPAYKWAMSIRGLSDISFAQIIGETGDLSNYSSKSKLWKRLGLAVFDGKAQGRVAGAKAIEQGFKPQRRAVMAVIGDNIKMAQVRIVKDEHDEDTGERKILGEYGRVYRERKAYELERDPEMKPVIAEKRALRYMEKRLLRDLWQQWRMEAGES